MEVVKESLELVGQRVGHVEGSAVRVLCGHVF